MSRDPSHEQGIAGSANVKAGVKDELPHHYPEFLERYVKYADKLPSDRSSGSERDDSPNAMFRRMDGAAVGSGAAAGAGVVLSDGDPCSSSLTKSHRPPATLNAASAGELCSLSTTPRVAVTVVPHRTGGKQVAAIVREVSLPAEGRERRPGEPRLTYLPRAPRVGYVTPCALEAKHREKQGRLKLEAAGRQQSMRQAAAIAAARGRAMEGGRCGSPQVFRAINADEFGQKSEICGIAIRHAVRSRVARSQAGGGETAALWPEVHDRAQLLAPQILQELTDAARQTSRSPSPLNSVASQIPLARAHAPSKM